MPQTAFSLEGVINPATQGNAGQRASGGTTALCGKLGEDTGPGSRRAECLWGVVRQAVGSVARGGMALLYSLGADSEWVRVSC